MKRNEIIIYILLISLIIINVSLWNEAGRLFEINNNMKDAEEAWALSIINAFLICIDIGIFLYFTKLGNKIIEEINKKSIRNNYGKK